MEHNVPPDPPVVRRWIPAEWTDEINPTLLESPDSYAERDGDGWALRLPADDPERDNEFYRMAVEPGQIVQFMWTEHYGTRILTIYRDGSFGTDYNIPEKATHFYEGGSGALADSLRELIDGDGINDALKPGQYTVDVYTWSESLSFRFDVDHEGIGRFHACAGVH